VSFSVGLLLCACVLVCSKFIWILTNQHFLFFLNKIYVDVVRLPAPVPVPIHNTFAAVRAEITDSTRVLSMISTDFVLLTA